MSHVWVVKIVFMDDRPPPPPPNKKTPPQQHKKQQQQNKTKQKQNNNTKLTNKQTNNKNIRGPCFVWLYRTHNSRCKFCAGVSFNIQENCQ